MLDDLDRTSLLSLSPAETSETVVELTTALSRLRALQLGVVAHADVLDLAATVDATSTAAWLRTLLPVTGAGATRDVRLACALAREAHDPAATGLAAGGVLAEQAAVIVAAVDALPASLGPADRRRAEEHLVAPASTHDAKELAVLGRRVLEVIDPDAADEGVARRLAAEEAAAARGTSLAMTDDGHGTTSGRSKVPTLVGEMLRTALHALANPARPDPIPRNGPDGTKRATPAVLGDAFVEYVQRFPVDKLPATGESTPPSTSPSRSPPWRGASRPGPCSAPDMSSRPPPPGGWRALRG